MEVIEVGYKNHWTNNNDLDAGDCLLLGLIESQVNFDFPIKRVARMFSANNSNGNEKMVQEKLDRLFSLGYIVKFNDILVSTDTEKNDRYNLIIDYTSREQQSNIRKQKSKDIIENQKVDYDKIQEAINDELLENTIEFVLKQKELAPWENNEDLINTVKAI